MHFLKKDNISDWTEEEHRLVWFWWNWQHFSGKWNTHNTETTNHIVYLINSPAMVSELPACLSHLESRFWMVLEDWTRWTGWTDWNGTAARASKLCSSPHCHLTRHPTPTFHQTFSGGIHFEKYILRYTFWDIHFEKYISSQQLVHTTVTQALKFLNSITFWRKNTFW